MTGQQRLRRWISDECPDRGLAESARVSGRLRLSRVSQFRRWCRKSLQLPWARQILILSGPLPLHRTVQQRCRVMGEWQVAGTMIMRSSRTFPGNDDCDTECPWPYPSRYFADARVTIAPTPRMRSKNLGQVLPTQSG